MTVFDGNYNTVQSRCVSGAWNKYLNKSKCGQYWTSINGADVHNYILLDKNGNIITDAQDFDAYYVIFITTTEVSVYRFQAENALNCNRLKFNKRGYISGYSIIMNCKYVYLGLGDQLVKNVQQGTDVFGMLVVRIEDQKKWVPALLKFTQEVYKY